MLPFEGGAGWFHLPFRCDRMTKEGAPFGLCLKCQDRKEKTDAKAAGITGTTMPGMLPACLNGIVGEPIPYWTRLIGSAWFNLKLEAGCRISEVDMARAKKAVVAAGLAGAEQPPPAPMPEGVKKRGGGRKKKDAAAPAAPAAQTIQTILNFPAAEEPVAPPPPPPPPAAAAPAPKKRGPKKAAGAAAAAAAPALDPLAGPVALLRTTGMPDPVEDILQIQVRSQEIDGRKVYVDSQKGKVYDLKFRSIGRWDTAADKIVPFPDSDTEA
jgi:hypothetical protein